LEALRSLSDLEERAVLVKNFEVFGERVLSESLKLEKIILSGNTDKSPAKAQVIAKAYATTIAFSEPETPLPHETLPLDKYVGFLKTKDKEGFVKLEK
jgi:hypothetical protein